MAMRWILLLSSCLLPIVAAADDGRDMRIDRSDCERLIPHVPAADVAYAPGVDVRGRPVVPADLGGAAAPPFPELFDIPIEVVLAERSARPNRSGRYEGRLEIGRVIVDAEGRAWLDGRQLIDDARSNLEAVCRPRSRPQSPANR